MSTLKASVNKTCYRAGLGEQRMRTHVSCLFDILRWSNNGIIAPFILLGSWCTSQKLENQKIRVYTLLGDTKELAEETTERVEGEQNLRKGLEMRRHSEKTALFTVTCIIFYLKIMYMCNFGKN